MPVKTNEREYRRLNSETIKLNDESYIVEGYATTFDNEYLLFDDGEYRVMESIDAGAFANADMSDVIMQYDHQGRVFARNRNNTLTLETDEHGLKIRADLGGTEIGRQLYEEIKGGYTDRMSWGFTAQTKEDVWTEEKDEASHKTIMHRKIMAINKIFDVSAVSLPANDATEISARSCGEGAIEAARQELAAIAERKRKIQRIKLLMEVENK